MTATLTHAAAIIVANLGADLLSTFSIVSIAAAIVVCWRSASAAHRHTVWLAALIASGVTIIASPWMPEFSLRLKEPAAIAAVRTIGIEATSIREGRSLTAETSIESSRSSGERSGGTAQQAISKVISRRLTWPVGVALLWLTGAIIGLTRVAAGLWSARRIAGHLRRVNDPMWAISLGDAMTRLGTRSGIVLAWGQERSVPVTFGILRPTIVIPTDAIEWTAEQRQLVLLHEVAHVARADVATQMLANVICALLWFQPLMWMARWRLRAEAESAADDCVLSTGVPAPAYAARLLEFARTSGLHTRVPMPAVGMFTHSNLERRFAAMLDTRRSRASTSRGVRRAAAVCALAGGTGVAGMRIAAPIHPNRALAPTVHPSGELVASAGSRLGAQHIAGDASNPVAAATPLAPLSRLAQSQKAGVPDFSGTWVPDTTAALPHGRMFSSPLVITIAQNDSTVWITRRGIGMGELLGTPSPWAWGSQYHANKAQASALVHLDGTKGDEVISFARPMVATDAITAAWDDRDLVTTSTQRIAEDGGWEWTRIDRWTLTSDSTLVRAMAIVIPAHGRTLDASTLTVKQYLIKAR